MRERTRREQVLRFVLPFAALAIGVLIWDLVVRINNIQPYVLPSPGLVFQTLIADWSILWPSLLSTLSTTFQALLLAVFGGVGLAILFNQSRVIEHSFYPYAVILQVTPVVAIAPLLLIYLPQQAAVLTCAWIVAFFPVLANTTLGLNSVDRNLNELFRLYGASRWQMLRDLKLPAALPYMLGGLKIAGGLSLIGAVVAEIAAGSAGAGSGLAFRIAEVGLPAQHSAHVRGAAIAVDHRRFDFRIAVARLASRSCGAGMTVRRRRTDSLVIPGRRVAPNPESRCDFRLGWIPGSLALLAPRNDR